MEAWSSKLLRYSRGYNPIEWVQIPFLTNTLKIAKEAHKEEEERIAKAKAMEYKHVMLSSRDDREYVNTRINREKLDKWVTRGLSGWRNVGGEIVDDFDELTESEYYYLIDDGKSNFGGYSRVEGDVQTQDCVTSILKGIVRIDNFGSSNLTKVIFEYSMTPPKAVQAEVPKLKFPIRPDALLILGDKWLFLESKH